MPVYSMKFQMLVITYCFPHL